MTMPSSVFYKVPLYLCVFIGLCWHLQECQPESQSVMNVIFRGLYWWAMMVWDRTCRPSFSSHLSFGTLLNSRPFDHCRQRVVPKFHFSAYQCRERPGPTRLSTPHSCSRCRRTKVPFWMRQCQLVHRSLPQPKSLWNCFALYLNLNKDLDLQNVWALSSIILGTIFKFFLENLWRYWQCKLVGGNFLKSVQKYYRILGVYVTVIPFCRLKMNSTSAISSFI